MRNAMKERVAQAVTQLAKGKLHSIKMLLRQYHNRNTTTSYVNSQP